MSNIIADIIFALSKNFNFDYKDAEYYMGLRDIKEMKCIFPFSGKIKEGCRAISWSCGGWGTKRRYHRSPELPIIPPAHCAAKEEGSAFF